MLPIAAGHECQIGICLMQIVSGKWREMSTTVNRAVGINDGPSSTAAASAASAAATANRLPPPAPTFYGDSSDERTAEKSNREEFLFLKCALTPK